MDGRYLKIGSRFVLYQKYNYALRNIFTDNYNATPSVAARNSFLSINSSTPTKATIDWGYGITQDFEFIQSTKGYYILTFRSLAVWRGE